MFADNPYKVDRQGLPRRFYAVTDYHQAEQDTPYLIFSCGQRLQATYPNPLYHSQTYCGLFNTSGNTEPGYESRYPYIGSLSDKTHESTGVGNYFLLAGLCSLEDPGSLGHTPQGIYYSGCLNWVVIYPRFGSHYYYYYYYFL